MIVEIGIYSLVLSFFISSFISITPYLNFKGVANIKYGHIKSLSISQFLGIVTSLACLCISFLYDDFSLSYVTNNSHSSLPLIYKISAIWGGHEGSLLIYITCISFWIILFIFFSKGMCNQQKIKTLSIISLFLSLILIMVLIFSSPFLSLYPNIPIDGNDLNPLLQDKSMIIHPPMLYLGYVGFIIPFAMSVVQLWDNKIDNNFSKWIKPWVVMPWGFLSLGIVLGSYWAYYELGWGGFWFWDPVENASFMPWITALALMHSVLASESNKSLLRNVIILSIITFFLSLLGTFLVRSGVVFSVHSFASDSSRGIYLLWVILIFIIFISYFFYKKSYLFEKRKDDDKFNRSVLINLNNIFLVMMMLSILFGTLYPLLSELIQGEVTSVGSQYFDFVFQLTLVPSALLMIISPITNWNKLVKKRLKYFYFTMIVNIILSAVFYKCFCLDYDKSLFCWILLITSIINSVFLEIYYSSIKIRKISMLLGHIGLAVLISGVLIVSKYEIEKDLALSVGDSVKLGQFDIIFSDIKKIKGSNFVGHKGIFDIKKNEESLGKIYPEKRLFIVQEIGMSETAIFTNFFYDIYVAITSPLNDSKTWAVRIYYKPCVRFIWFGGILVFISSLSIVLFFIKNNRKLQ